jgi:CheY-like chemotaxis protein
MDIGTTPRRGHQRQERLRHPGGREPAPLPPVVPPASGRTDRPQPVILELNLLVREMERTLARAVRDDVEFLLSLSPDAGPVRVDRAQLEAVLLHLVVNATDAMPAGGRVTVETRFVTLATPMSQRGTTLDPGRYAVLAVSDTGTGMTPDTWKRLFDPLFTTKAGGASTGPGLVTCDAIVRDAGGLIFADSELGAGSVFTVLLPPADRRVPPSASACLEGHETILVLEDCAGVRTVVRRMLEGLGYRVLESATAEQALAIADAHRADLDLVLSDVVLQGVSGAEVVRQIQARAPRVRSMLMSGHTLETLSREHRLPDGAAFIQKPFDRRAFARKIREVLGA